MKKGLRRRMPRLRQTAPAGPSACPDEEGIKTSPLPNAPLALGPSACPDEEGIKTESGGFPAGDPF